MTMTMTSGRSRSRSLNLSGAGAGNFKNGRLRHPGFYIESFKGGVGAVFHFNIARQIKILYENANEN